MYIYTYIYTRYNKKQNDMYVRFACPLTLQDAPMDLPWIFLFGWKTSTIALTEGTHDYGFLFLFAVRPQPTALNFVVVFETLTATHCAVVCGARGLSVDSI